jgi:metal transporter CNNM
MLLQKLWGIALRKKHEGEESLPAWEWWTYLGISAGLVLMAGMMSGLTLGLMSLDEVDMEVGARAAAPKQQQLRRHLQQWRGQQQRQLQQL